MDVNNTISIKKKMTIGKERRVKNSSKTKDDYVKF